MSEVEDAILKMATELLLPGIRPHELVILDRLCRLPDERPGDAASDDTAWTPSAPITRSTLIDAIRADFPQADLSDVQFDSAIGVLDYSYFTGPNRKRFGGQPLIDATDVAVGSGEPAYRLNATFVAMLAHNRTFRIFFADTLRTGLANCRDLFQEARENRRAFDRAFLYERKYSMADVMRLCGWRKENTPQNVGGYLLDKETGTMPIFVKYAASQYEDEFLNAQEMRYYSKNGRTPQSPEFRWVRGELDGDGSHAGGGAGAINVAAGATDWQRTHFVPLFVMRKAEEADGRYYYVGHVATFEHPTLTTKPTASGEGRVNVTLSTLRLAKPLDPELYRHLTS